MRFNPPPRKIAGQTLSMLLAAAMIVTSFPQTALPVNAADANAKNISTILTDADTDIASDSASPDGEPSADQNAPDGNLPDNPDTPDETQPDNPNTSDDTLPDNPNTSDDTLPDTPDTPDDTLPDTPDTPDDTLPDTPDTPDDTLPDTPDTPDDTLPDNPDTPDEIQPTDPDGSQLLPSQPMGDDDDTSSVFQITFDLLGHGEAIDPLSVEAGGKLEDTDALKPVAEGFRFDGWFKDEAYTQKWDFETDTVTEAITLYAKWTAVFTVTFELSDHGEAIDPLTVEAGGKLEDTDALKPVEKGFRFDGWFKDSELTEKWNFETDTVTENITLYAKWEAITYTVTFQLSGHGQEIEPQEVAEGEKLKEPVEPTEEGWQFLNWYTDAEYSEIWDFQYDEVTADLTLYAKWVQLSSLQVAAIPSQPFTGKAIKPAVSVYYIESDEEGSTTRTPLKANKDYKVSYKNNTNTSAYVKNQEQLKETWAETDTLAGGSSSTGAKVEGGFNPALPYLIIEGKGNYSGKLYMNFEITQIALGNGSESAAANITLQCSDQFPIGKPKKDQKTITSLKFQKIALKENIDYTAAIEGAETTGSVLSKDDSLFVDGGDCTLTITGIGNYTGSIVRPIIVRENSTLLKNASISLGSKCKSKPLTEEGVTLIPAYQETVEEEKTNSDGDPVYDKNGDPVMVKKTYYYQYIDGSWVTSYEVYDEKKDEYVTKALDKNNAFSVKIGGKWLKYGEDYDIAYANNTSVGTATMTIKGMGEYTGSKSVTFKITKPAAKSGKKFNSSTIKVNNWQSKMTYTGSELTQSDIALVTKKSTKVYDCGMQAGEIEDEWEDDNGKVHKIKHKHTSDCYHVEVEHEFDGSEYTVTYTNNVRVGTATVTFTTTPESEYSGSFKMTFKITGINVAEFVTFNGSEGTLEPTTKEVSTGKKDEYGDPIMKTVVETTRTMEGTVPYVKSGATLNFSLTNGETTLVLGQDYTISYKNHKNITKMKSYKIYEEEYDDDGNPRKVWNGEYETKPDSSKMGVLTIKGKGNYTGTLTIKYQIIQGEMVTEGAVVTVERSLYSPNTKTYKPKVTVWTPNAGTLASNEYSVRYNNNTKAAVNAYWESLTNGDTPDDDAVPSVTVILKKNNCYSNLCDIKDEDGTVTKYEPIELDPVSMVFYPHKLTAKNLYIIIDNENPKELVYTGKQVTNVRARVYFGTDAAVKAAKKKKVTNHRLLTSKTDAGGQYGLIRLTESPKDEEGKYTNGGDYTLTFGKNNAIGKNKGSVTVNGTGDYGGSVSQKFQIFQKPVYYSVAAGESTE